MTTPSVPKIKVTVELSDPATGAVLGRLEVDRTTGATLLDDQERNAQRAAEQAVYTLFRYYENDLEFRTVGRSPLEKASTDVAIDEAITEAQHRAFTNGVYPGKRAHSDAAPGAG